MSVWTAGAPRSTAEMATVRGSVRLALGTTVALPTAMAFLGLSVAVVLARSLTALGARVLAREIDENPP
jgi:hypothetical protein